MRPCNITTLLLASISSILTGICGVFPVLLIRSSDRAAFDAKSLHKPTIQIFPVLNRWLSFATGSLVGDVFLHLLPEAWLHSEGKKACSSLSVGCSLPWGVGLISGIAVFLCVEKISSLYDADVRAQSNPSVQYNDHIIGYLNLAANATDNFTHGLSIGVSYLTSNKCGLLTTSCILIHEVPHEIADFVILLRSGFSRWAAVKAQLLTASTCLVGTLSVLLISSDSKAYGNWVAQWEKSPFFSVFALFSEFTIALAIAQTVCMAACDLQTLCQSDSPRISANRSINLGRCEMTVADRRAYLHLLTSLRSGRVFFDASMVTFSCPDHLFLSTRSI
ncbi:unnamed protein product [Schistocephalus solidus]|uniref:Zinc transporter ZIP13 n=1 Tax=Schistocephalus solidus TaxID=70667 RepID=A0A183T1E1_SCHSO|nr:unnamed protein product [Schistocephalus solidus]